MNLNRYTDEGLDELIDDIARGLKKEDRYTKLDVLTDLVTTLDLLSEDDVFGTEGWEHRFGVED